MAKRKIPRRRADRVTVMDGPPAQAARLYIELYTSPDPKRRRELLHIIEEADDGATLVLEQIRTGMLKPDQV